MIHLEKVTEGNYRECIRLKVAEDQINHVATNAVSLARAYVYYDSAKPFVVYENDLMVGFVLLRSDERLKCYIIDQFMIDEHYQGKGYGKQTMKLLIEMIKQEKKYSKVILCYVDGNEIVKKLYKGLGSYHTGEIDENEIIMELDIA